MPSRVIDIGVKKPISFVRLHWTEEGKTGDYAALSYCWGGEQPVKSTRATAQDYTDGIRFSKFPKTLQDAMLSVNRLGLRYIWIDCICIIRDDPEDVAREIAKMPQIFQEAFVTISASCARSMHEGFLHARDSTPETRLKLPFKTPKGSIGSIVLEKPRRYSPEQEPISLRAWTLQEHMLSPRILDYGSRELWWICRTIKQYDNGGDPADLEENSLEPGSNLTSIDRTSLDSWRSTLHDYTRRFLTFPGDKFPAISGIAADYGEIFNSEYLAGLWHCAFPSELLWSTARSDISRPAVQRAPSWSWASVDGEISHKWCPRSIHCALVVLECRVTPVSLSAPYGSINPVLSYLKVKGEMKKFEWSQDRQILMAWTDDRFPGCLPLGRSQADADEIIPSFEIRREDADKTISTYDAIRYTPTFETRKTLVWGLIVTQYPTRGLLLVPVAGDCFRRVGVFFRL